MRCLSIAVLIAAIMAGILAHRPAPHAGIAPHVSQAYGALASLRDGDLVTIAVDFDPASRPELTPFVSLVIDAALARRAHIVTLSLWPHGAMLADEILRDRLQAHRGTYGADAINLGYVEGRSAAVHGLGLALERFATRDHQGTPLGDLPLSRAIQTLADSALVVTAASGTPGIYDWLLQGQDRFAKHLLAGTTSLLAPEMAPFVASGQLEGLVGGARDVTALADLLRMNAGNDTPSYVQRLYQQMRAQRWAHLAILACIAVGHVLMLVKRKEAA
jgi:hypothetical protein